MTRRERDLFKQRHWSYLYSACRGNCQEWDRKAAWVAAQLAKPIDPEPEEHPGDAADC